MVGRRTIPLPNARGAEFSKDIQGNRREFSFFARGNSQVSAVHKTCLEITRNKELTKNGDCILATSADVGASGLPCWLKNHLRQGNRIAVMIETESERDTFQCVGSEKMTFEAYEDLVFRKSAFVCGRTIGIASSKSANDIDRRLVKELKRNGTLVKFTIVAWQTDCIHR